MPTDEPVKHADPHSGYGLASFTLAILICGYDLVLYITTAVLHVQSPPPGGDDRRVATGMVLGCANVLGLLAGIVGVILGIAGCCERDVRKVYAVLGLVANAGVFLGGITLTVVGILLRRSP